MRIGKTKASKKNSLFLINKKKKNNNRVYFPILFIGHHYLKCIWKFIGHFLNSLQDLGLPLLI